MNKFLCRVLPVLLLSMVAAACATTEPPVATTRPAGATPPSITGTWVPRSDIASNFRAARGGILNADIRGDTAVVTWAGQNQKLTLVRPPLRTVGAGGGEWTGAVTLDDGTRATLTLRCPAPDVNESGRPYMVCRSLVQGNQLHDNPLLLLRAPTPARAPANR